MITAAQEAMPIAARLQIIAVIAALLALFWAVCVLDERWQAWKRRRRRIRGIR